MATATAIAEIETLTATEAEDIVDANIADEIMQEMQLEALQAIADMQEISEKNGNSKMSLKEVNELISDVRKSKRI